MQKSLRFTNLSLDKDGKPKLIYYMFDRNRKIDRDDAVIFNLKQNTWYNFDAQLKKTKFSGTAPLERLSYIFIYKFYNIKSKVE